MNKDEPLSPLQKTQEALRFRATRKTYWDKLDQYVFGRLFDNHWPSLSQQDKQSCLAQTLNDLFLVERMLPEIQTVPPSALFDLYLATRIERPRWSSDHAERWLEVARQFLEKGSNPNHVGEDPLGIGPFSVLEKSVSFHCREEPLERTLRWMGLLLDAGADPSLKGHPEHGPPLEMALRWKSPEGMLLLLERGADPAAATLVDRRSPSVAAAFRAWEKSRRLENSLGETPLPSAKGLRL